MTDRLVTGAIAVLGATFTAVGLGLLVAATAALVVLMRLRRTTDRECGS